MKRDNLLILITFILILIISIIAVLFYHPQYKIYIINGIKDECLYINNFFCGKSLSNCKSGNSYECVTNLIIVK